MDPSNTQNSSEGQRISVLQVATPASVIMAAPASPGVRPAERAGIRVCESSTTTASALLVRQAGAGGTPIIVGLIPSDATGLSGLGNAAVFSVSPNTTATGTRTTSTTIGSLVQITQVPQTGQTVYTSPTSQTGLKITKERSQTSQTSTKERSQTGMKSTTQTSQTSAKEWSQTSQTSGSQTGIKSTTQTSQTSTKERGQSVGMSLGTVIGTPPPQAASTTATGGHGAGKPKSFAAMMAGLESPLASSKKQTASTKKGLLG